MSLVVQCLKCKLHFGNDIMMLEEHSKNCLTDPSKKSKKKVSIKKDLNGSIGCMCCECVFSRYDDFLSHVRSHLENDDVGGVQKDLVSKSSFCTKCCATFYLMREHNAFVHEGKPERRCTMCGIACLDELSLTKHLLSHTSYERKCYFCGQVFGHSYSQFLTHLKNHTELHLFSCAPCGQTFLTKSLLIQHNLLSNHDIFTPKLLCIYCGMECQTKRAQRVHIEQYHHEINISDMACPICFKSFNNRKSYRGHVMRHSKVLPFQCPKCPKRFLWKYKLNAHFQTHVMEKLFHCEICKKYYRNQSVYLNHMRSHSLKFTCEYCSKEFTRKSSIKEHLVPSVVGLNCPECSKTFFCHDSLNQHTKEHSEFEFNCEFCVKSFSNIRSLRRHVTIEHFTQAKIVEKFICNVCNHVCNTKHNLARHKRRKHGLDSVRIDKKKRPYVRKKVANFNLSRISQDES